MAHPIPQTQTAAVIPDLAASLTIQDSPVVQPSELAPGECLVEIECTGVCHTDLHAKHSDWPVKPKYPLIGGHEGVGTVVAIGMHTPHSDITIGTRVGIKWLAYSCLTCEYCRKGLEQNCVKALLSGYTTDGTFAQYTKSWVNHVSPIPKNLKSTEAASLLCAGVTVYRALRNSNTYIGDWVVIPGSGGGLGHLAVQYATAMGLRVLAIDTGEKKKKLSLDLGAESFIDFGLTKDLVKDIKHSTGGAGAHAAVITAANPAAYMQAVEYLRCGGTLVVVGMPAGKLGADIFFTVYKSISIVGSYVGNRQDAIEALDIAASGKVKVRYAMKPLSKLEDTFKGLEEGSVVGRVVLDVPQ
ncbi:GroES-like protein [Gautieria morchelliformis]|nr:GroES-like protein [Gautieria morchelliformis]